MVNHFTAHTLQTTVWLGNINTVLGLEKNHGLGLNTVVTLFQSYSFRLLWRSILSNVSTYVLHTGTGTPASSHSQKTPMLG